MVSSGRNGLWSHSKGLEMKVLGQERAVWGWMGSQVKDLGQASNLGEDVGCIGRGSGQRGEEGGLACRLDRVDHPQLGIFQVGGLAVSVDEHKHIVHTCRMEAQPEGSSAQVPLLCA